MSRSDLSGRFKSERIPWTDDEMELVLAYYIFIYEYTTRKADYESFTNDLRKLTGNSRSYGSVGVRFGNYISVDPTKDSTGFKGGDKRCQEVWDKCIGANRKPKDYLIKKFLDFILKFGNKKSIYDDFVKTYSYLLNKKSIDYDDEEGIISTDDVSAEETATPSYAPEEKPSLVAGNSKKYKRDNAKAKRALVISKYKCNLDENHISFESKSGHPYMEAHHLIPLGEQDSFENSLDVDANIVSLCPNCHRKLHHGKNIDSDLKKLYDDRKDLLHKSGIDITFDELSKLYK